MRPCKEWAGARKDGYGVVWWEGKLWRVHRLAYFLQTGELPPAVRHTCDNPPCYEGEHLVPGTQADNMRDMKERGRARHPSTALNPGLPDQRVDRAAYKREVRRRKLAGTWVYRGMR